MPWDIIPDLTSVLNVNQEENFGAQQEGEKSTKDHEKCDGTDLTIDSCSSDNSWWKEAINFADQIEKMKDTTALCEFVSKPFLIVYLTVLFVDF